ncbi:LytTR family DNA-binding domain-containing protein [uncultured Sphingomonas sp.]|uniref:LytTR family DNA-binding domain-containing protein n=1 Tax=uncultured Sphingomonas sp. TaxID=158754 RepID=UPI0025D82436|nr:LytTR family DNA-binding domain-containing protein [uncultured Sphingomonas sp.]
MTRSTSLSPVFTASAPPLLRSIGVAVVLGALLAILGPFGSYMNGGLIGLAGYWIGAMLLGLMLYGSAYRILSASIAPGSVGWWPALIGAALLASVPEALATRTAAFWLWPDLAQLRLPFLVWFVQTTTIGMVCMVGMAFILRRAATPQERHVPFPSSPAGETPLSGTVLALQMEDHYVRVHRPCGSELLLMPLGRAIECMEAEGLRTHRSWWVARHAVAAVEGNTRSMRVHLSNGLVAPVARSAVAHLKAAGWIVDAASSTGLRKQEVAV